MNMKVLRILLAGCLIICYSQGASAQEYRYTEREVIIERDSFIVPKMALKFSPTSLYPLVNPSLQFAFEHRFEETRAMQYELGVLLPYDIQFFERLEGGGFRARVEYRKYLSEISRTGNFFIGGQYLFQEEFRPMSDWIWRADGGYEEFFEYKKNVMSHGALFVVGSNRTGRNGRRFLFEWSTAIGLRARTVFNNGLPSDATIESDAFFPFLEAMVNINSSEPAGTLIIPTMQFSLKFGAVLK
jgi:hypothetical protein